MLTVLTNIRSTKVLWKDGHHQITTFFIVHKFGSQKFLPDRNLARNHHKTLQMRSLRWMRFTKAKYLEDDLLWKKTFGGRQPLVEDNLQQKTIFSGRQPSVVDDFQWNATFLLTPFLYSHSTTETKLELLSTVSTGNRICHHRKMYVALCMHTCAKKDISRQR